MGKKKKNNGKASGFSSLKKLIKNSTPKTTDNKDDYEAWIDNLRKKDKLAEQKLIPKASKLKRPELSKKNFLVALKSTTTVPAELLGSDENQIICSQKPSRAEQIYDGSAGLTEVVIGLDLGTTTTKVIIMEQGSKTAWAIPFTLSRPNPYLLPTIIYRHEGIYSLEPKGSKIQDLKKILIESKSTRKIPEETIAFLTIVISYAKTWFLNNAAKSFPGFEFDWLINIGMPAADYNSSELVDIFKVALQCSADLSTGAIDQLSNRSIFNYLSYLNDTPQRQWGEVCSVHPECLNIFPEIAAQLHGYVNSDRWDSQRAKFMLVDVGGSTVDASIVNVTKESNGGLKYSFLKSKVTFQGTVILHRERIDWIKNNTDHSHKIWPTIEGQLNESYTNFNQMAPVPDQVSMYLNQATFPTKNSDHDFDKNFYNRYGVGLYEDIIAPVRTEIDAMHSQWGALQFLLCGGGSLHPLYNRFVQTINNNDSIHVCLDQSRIEMPDNLIAKQLDINDYHRLSVAYGLAHENLGVIIAESNMGSRHRRGKIVR